MALKSLRKTEYESPEITVPPSATKMEAGVVCASSSHIGTRAYQQDSTETGHGRGKLVFGILCDGMGGLEGGELASSTAAKTLALSLCEMDPTCDIPTFLEAQAHMLNQMIRALPALNGERGLSGTTLTAAVIINASLYWLSVGDSRIYIIREQEIAVVTRDHSYALTLEQRVREGKLTAVEAAGDPQRDALISFLGMEELELIDFNRNAFALRDGDLVLLCSDGLYRSLCEADILDVIDRHRDDLNECARVLPLYAFDKAQGSHDNTSVVLLRYQNGTRSV